MIEKEIRHNSEAPKCKWKLKLILLLLVVKDFFVSNWRNVATFCRWLTSVSTSRGTIRMSLM